MAIALPQVEPIDIDKTLEDLNLCVEDMYVAEEHITAPQIRRAKEIRNKLSDLLVRIVRVDNRVPDHYRGDEHEKK